MTIRDRTAGDSQIGYDENYTRQQEACRQRRADLQRGERKHFLSAAPSADKTAEGAFPIFGKALKLT